MRVGLADATGASLAEGRATLELRRPVERVAPVQVPLEPAGPGAFEGRVVLSRAGQFDARVVVNRIESLTGRDLVVTREEGVLVISYAYDHKIVILDRVILLIRYQGSTREALR